MTRTLNETEVRYLTLLREVIRERGADFRYDMKIENPQVGPLGEVFGGACVYMTEENRGLNADVGSCLIGKLIIEKLHVHIPFTFEGAGFGRVMAERLDLPDYKNLSQRVMNALADAQSMQDAGHEYRNVWGEVLRCLTATMPDGFYGEPYTIDLEEWAL